jgi:archaemetzincin
MVASLPLGGSLLLPACDCRKSSSSGSSVRPFSRGDDVPEVDSAGVSALDRAIARLAPLHRRLGKPRPGEWLAEHEEEGQTFAAYVESSPVVAAGRRRVLYIQPLGPLTEVQRSLVQLTAEYMRRFFGLDVRLSPDLPLSLVPESARRLHPRWGVPQILTAYVLEQLLEPRLPDDAAAYISFTASDLWPGDGWNFVFGQASLRDRVGVWSIYRYGDPAESSASFAIALERTLKVAVHETGHMFSLRHCTAYECVMGGSNSLDESDRRPLTLCPECMAKICWATRRDPAARYRQLADFASEHQFVEHAAFLRRSIAALER